LYGVIGDAVFLIGVTGKLNISGSTVVSLYFSVIGITNGDELFFCE